MRTLYRINADGREMMVIADSKKEVMEYCYKIFDYSSINIKEISHIENYSEYPIIYDRMEFQNV